MERVTQTTAATAEESAAASEELNAQAESSIAVVGKLDGWRVGGGDLFRRSAAHGPAAAAPAQAALKTAQKGRRAPAKVAAGRTRNEEQFPLSDGQASGF